MNAVHRSGSWAAIAIGAALPFSVFLDNVLLGLALAAWVAGGAWREKLAAIGGNPVVLSAMALFALLAAGTLWGESKDRDAALYLVKYGDLIAVVPLAWLLREPGTQARALRAFASGLALLLVLSCLVQAGLLPAGRWVRGEAGNAVVVKYHLTHNILMAYGAFLFAELALAARTARWRSLLGALAVLAVANVLLMVQGRTGYIVLGALALYMGYRLRGWRGLAAALAATGAVAIGLSFVPGVFQDRWRTLVDEVRAARSDVPARTSTGLRLEFYRYTLDIVREHPVLGVGTGAFPKAYDDRVTGRGGILGTRNPHNEYLHIAAQVGVPGLALFLWLLSRQWRHAPRLASPPAHHLARALVLTIGIGCLFNSLLLDHTEGLMYAWLTAALFGGLRPESDTPPGG
ncbi:MAG: O-antigen ligase family protein [Burkholderiales bacterium]|nr:O-antigen ligase family protein [Burkholderiales bacterium]